jgi:hypothetical protein
MGAFASMAQNSYGLKIMGGVACAFGVVFLFEFIFGLRNNENKDIYDLAETACLSILSFIFALRIFYIHFPFVELLFFITVLVLVVLYVRKMRISFNKNLPQDRLFALLVLVFQLCIILFLLALILVPFAPVISQILGAVTFIILLGDLTAAVLKPRLLIDGEQVSVFKTISRFKDHSIVIVSLFLLFSLYTGFNRVGILPGIYSDEFPQAYYKMIDGASATKEKLVPYQEFKEKYDLFIEHNSSKKQ